MRVTGLPEDITFVFSSIYRNDGRLGVLKDCKVEAVMESFEYIRNEPPQRIFDYISWPTRRYMDSGIFTLMNKSGTHRISSKKHGAQRSLLENIYQLKDDFLAYHREHLHQWDHVVEIDADNIPGAGYEYTLEFREELLDVIGDKLLPVWHVASEQGAVGSLRAWKSLIKRFPYVAVGGDPHRDERLLRHMVGLAHANGTKVHALGITGPREFKSIGWDTGDSTNWVSGARYGNFVGLRAARNMNPQEVSKLRANLEYLKSHGISAKDLLASGKSYAKLYISVIRELDRQAELREWAAAMRED